MILNHKQAYLTAFHFLKGIYQENHDSELGDLLSSMNPYLFLSSNSADPAVWEDWISCVLQIRDGEKLTDNEALQSMLLFLKFNQEEFEYDFNWIIKEVEDGIREKKWIETAEKVLQSK